MKYNGDYPVKSWIECIDAYVVPDDQEKWSPCSCCGLRPRVWSFDNGRYTACGCGKDKYDIFSVRAESITSVFKRTKSFIDYDSEALKTNWNHWCKTGEHLFTSDNGTW